MNVRNTGAIFLATLLTVVSITEQSAHEGKEVALSGLSASRSRVRDRNWSVSTSKIRLASKSKHEAGKNDTSKKQASKSSSKHAPAEVKMDEVVKSVNIVFENQKAINVALQQISEKIAQNEKSITELSTGLDSIKKEQGGSVVPTSTDPVDQETQPATDAIQPTHEEDQLPSSEEENLLKDGIMKEGQKDDTLVDPNKKDSSEPLANVEKSRLSRVWDALGRGWDAVYSRKHWIAPLTFAATLFGLNAYNNISAGNSWKCFVPGLEEKCAPFPASELVKSLWSKVASPSGEKA